MATSSSPSRPCGAGTPACSRALLPAPATTHTRRGGALLAVLWLSAALAVIAFSLASTVRGETERTGTAVDGLRSHYLAEGALRRAILYIEWGLQHPDVPRFQPRSPVHLFDFPSGQATVEVLPETAKFNINNSNPEDLFRLLASLGVPPEPARDIVAAIVDWRTPAANASPFDAFYESLHPPFHAPHAPFADIEELLSVRGVTPDLYYGTWERTPEGAAQRFVPRTGLRDCVSVFGATDQFDVNTAAPEVLAAAGVPPDVVAAIVQQRRIQPFQTPDQLAPFAKSAGPAGARLRIGGNSIFTMRSTARLRLPNGQWSDMRRTVSALVKLMPPGYDAPYHILRWYDN